jgi:hypothetical protein
MLLILAGIFSLAAQAEDAVGAKYKASSTTDVGQGNVSEALAFSGDHPTSATDDAGAVDWSAGYTYSRTSIGTSSNRTSAIDLSVGYRKSLDAGATFKYSRTPEESLTAAGPGLWLGYSLDLTRGKVQVDGSASTGAKAEVLKELSAKWKLGLGLDHETSESQGEENLTVLDLAYSF